MFFFLIKIIANFPRKNSYRTRTKIDEIISSHNVKVQNNTKTTIVTKVMIED